MKPVFFLALLLLFISNTVFAQSEERVRIITNNGGRYEGMIVERYEKYIRIRTEEHGEISILKTAIHSEWPLEEEAKLDSGTVRVQMKDGNSFYGTILEENSSQIKLKTDIGELSLARSQIKLIEYDVNKEALGKYGNEWIGNLNATRYFFSPNSLSLEPGSGYYQNIMVFVNQFAVGVTKNFSLGVGLVPIFLLGAGETPVWITPRVNFQIVEGKLSVGGGGLFGTIISYNENFGIYYGNVTIGNEDKNFAVNFGRSFDGGTSLTVSGMFRTGPKFYGMGEFLYIEEVGLLFLGGRSLLKTVSLDYGALIFFDGFIAGAIPFLSLTVPFGKSKY